MPCFSFVSSFMFRIGYFLLCAVVCSFSRATRKSHQPRSCANVARVGCSRVLGAARNVRSRILCDLIRVLARDLTFFAARKRAIGDVIWS